ncbi:MAG: hypothetical protein R3338_06790, partial [Thermoanaerobaculia bacterium]|nr:hypothetical protein [Thermoanaerobaculia bacterium]
MAATAPFASGETPFSYSFPASEKIYLRGEIHPEIRVPMRRITLAPTRGVKGTEPEPNPPVVVYDTSGPYSDPDASIDIRRGLPRLREPWIRNRKGCTISEAEARPSVEEMPPPKKPLRGDGLVTQLQLARAGVITPEMEFVAIRENLARHNRHLAGRRHAGES